MLLPPALWCCACPCGTGPGRSCTRRGLCGWSRPAAPCARSVAPCSGSHPFCSDPQPIVDRMRPELKGGGACATTSRRSSRGGSLGAWGAAGAAGGAVSESVFHGRTLASHRCAVCIAHLGGRCALRNAQHFLCTKLLRVQPPHAPRSLEIHCTQLFQSRLIVPRRSRHFVAVSVPVYGREKLWWRCRSRRVGSVWGGGVRGAFANHSLFLPTT